MARPRKKGLTYFPFDVNFFDDIKVFRLMEKYGTKGVVIYQALLCRVYREGYYLESELDAVCALITKTIGSEYVNKQFVNEVIEFCAETKLLDAELLSQGVITSLGIQKRYREAFIRRKTKMSNYTLLGICDADENEKSPEIASENDDAPL